MTTTLFTFLGRVPTGESGYRKTSYDFGDGSPAEPVAFFGWALQKRIGTERLVVMGTEGSMWDQIFEGDIPFGQEGEEARIHVIDAANTKTVRRPLLAPLEKPLSDRLRCDVRLVLIPYCRDEREQVDLLRIMGEHVEAHDMVHIDVSHGFRHLPGIWWFECPT
jgi:CRISPR-associated Csx2 family protein